MLPQCCWHSRSKPPHPCFQSRHSCFELPEMKGTFIMCCFNTAINLKIVITFVTIIFIKSRTCTWTSAGPPIIVPCITTCCWAIWKKEYFNHSILWPQNNLKYDSQSKFSPFSEIGILLKIGLLFCFVRGQILNWALFDFLSMQNNDDLSLKSDSCQKWKVKVWLNSYLGLKTESIDIDKEWPNCQPIIWCDFHIFPHISIYLHIFPYLSIVVLKPSRNLMWFSYVPT